MHEVIRSPAIHVHVGTSLKCFYNFYNGSVALEIGRAKGVDGGDKVIVTATELFTYTVSTLINLINC